MYEYEIYNTKTNEHEFVYGRSAADAWAVIQTFGEEAKDWKVIFADYID